MDNATTKSNETNISGIGAMRWASTLRILVLATKWILDVVNAPVRGEGEVRDIVFDTFPHYIHICIYILVVLSSLAIWSSKLKDFRITFIFNCIVLFGYLIWLWGSLGVGPNRQADSPSHSDRLDFYFSDATWWDMSILALSVLCIILQMRALVSEARKGRKGPS